MNGGDLCDADVGDLREADDGELAIACSQTPQLPPSFSLVYRCAADVGDRHQRLLRKGHTLASRMSVTFARWMTVSLPQHVHKRYSFPQL